MTRWYSAPTASKEMRKSRHVEQALAIRGEILRTMLAYARIFGGGRRRERHLENGGPSGRNMLPSVVQRNID